MCKLLLRAETVPVLLWIIHTICTVRSVDYQEDCRDSLFLELVHAYHICHFEGLCLIITILVSVNCHQSPSRLVCYYNSLAEDRRVGGKVKISDIDPNQCTHLIFAFSSISSQNELVARRESDIQRYQSFNALKTRNSLLKTLLAVGDTERFNSMASTQVRRQLFIQSAITLLRTYGFDGLNLDWRFPAEAGTHSNNKHRFTLLCQELKQAFVNESATSNQDRLILTASVSAEKGIIDASYEVAQVASNLDFINVMTFDFRGSSETLTGHHSPLYQGSQDIRDKINSNTDYAMNYWMDQGAPPHKLNLGIAFNGQVYTVESTCSGVGAPVNSPGTHGIYTQMEGKWAYYEICPQLAGAQVQLITDQKVPFVIVGNNQWIGFDNRNSVGTKANYITTNHFGGAFVWSLDLDDFSGLFCNQGNYPLISELHNRLVPDFPDFTTTPTTPTTTNDPNNFCSGKADGVHANPNDPTSFYNCAHGRTHLQQCPASLVFNSNCKCCDFTTAPITTLSSTLTPPPTTTTDPANFCSGKADGVHANPNDPTSFYNCDNGRTQIQQCPASLVFNSICKCCDYTTAPITTPSSTLTPPQTSTTDPANFCSRKADGVHANPNDPNSFYNCDHGITYLQQCATGLIFSTNCHCCDFP